MRITILAEDRYQVVATMEGDACPTLDFLEQGEEATRSWRNNLSIFLEHIAREGFRDVSAAQVREASKIEKILEFRKGDLRLFFFKGQGHQIAVCTAGLVKKGQRADKGAVAKAADLRRKYFLAVEDDTIEVIT